jgi:hypothetical protein
MGEVFPTAFVRAGRHDLRFFWLVSECDFGKVLQCDK